MIDLQILNKCISSGNFDLVVNNNLTEDYFAAYPDEYNFIKYQVNRFGKVPDKETMLLNFPEFTLLDVKETDEYLIATIREEYLYGQMVPVITECADLVKMMRMKL